MKVIKSILVPLTLILLTFGSSRLVYGQEEPGLCCPEASCLTCLGQYCESYRDCPVVSKTDKNETVLGYLDCVDGACVEPDCLVSPECGCGVSLGPDLSLTKTPSTDEIGVDRLLTYTLTITNNGEGRARLGTYTVKDNLPQYTEFDRFSPDSANCTVAESTVTCQPLVDIGPDGSFAFTISVLVLPGAPKDTTLVNTACVDNPATGEPECDTTETLVNLPPVCGDGTVGSAITIPHILRVDLDYRYSDVIGFATDPDDDYLTFANWVIGPPPPFGNITPTGPQTSRYHTPPGDDWIDQLPQTVEVSFNVSDGYNEPISCTGDLEIVNRTFGSCTCLDDDSCEISEENGPFCGVDGCGDCEIPLYTILTDPETSDECLSVFNRCEADVSCGTCDSGVVTDGWFRTIGGSVHSNFPYQSSSVNSLESRIPASAVNPSFSLSLNEAQELSVGHGGQEMMPDGSPDGGDDECCGDDGGTGTGVDDPDEEIDVGVISGSKAPMKFGAGIVSTRGWRIDAYSTQIYVGLGEARRFDYAFFWDRYGQATKTDLGDSTLSGSLPGGVYLRQGDLTIDAPFSVSRDNAVVVFVTGGDLNINALVTVEVGGYLAFITDRSVIISPSLGGDLDHPAVQGVYIANGQIITQSAGENADRQLFAAGTFVAYNGFGLYRDLEDDTDPAETFIYRPDLIVNTPQALQDEERVWRSDPR